MKINLKKWQIALLLITLVFAFFLVYKPHLNYPYPFHVDEWHHVSEGMRLGNYGEYFQFLRIIEDARFNGIEIGFHFLLFLLSFFFDLVLIYKFLPAIWICVSVATLFYVVYKKSDHNFMLAWFSTLFFISIKSNVNVLGLWFFTPLTFAIPFIFLYVYYFSEAIEKQNKKFIIIGSAIMALVIPIHALSVLFFIPALLIYLRINARYVAKEWKFFSLFLLVPILGVLFYKYTLAIPWPQLLGHMWTHLQFKFGWGVLEVKNSLVEIYSWIGYILAVVGVLFIILDRNTKKYALFLLWPATTFLLIIIYRLTGVSYLSPYQRNLYYFAISLPILSALGLFGILEMVKTQLEDLKFGSSLIPDDAKKLIYGGVIFLVMILAFISYYNIPKQLELYQAIDNNDYEALSFLAKLPEGGTVVALPLLSSAIYPISGHEPLASVAFYGDSTKRQQLYDFFVTADCQDLNTRISYGIQNYNIKYILTKIPINCDWPLIYQKNNFIYKVQ